MRGLCVLLRFIIAVKGTVMSLHMLPSTKSLTTTETETTSNTANNVTTTVTTTITTTTTVAPALLSEYHGGRHLATPSAAAATATAAAAATRRRRLFLSEVVAKSSPPSPTSSALCYSSDDGSDDQLSSDSYFQMPMSCNLTENEWIFIIGTGRSGTTTLLSMVNKLPGVQISGEHNGIIKAFVFMRDKIKETKKHRKSRGAWLGAAEAGSDNEVYCLTQRWFFLHTGSHCSGASIHGFKEIRYASKKTLDFIASAFPRARFIIAFRNDIEKQAKSSWHQLHKSSDETLQESTDSLNQWADEHPQKVFKMPLEAFSTSLFDQMYNFLGFGHCKTIVIQHDNSNGSYLMSTEGKIECNDVSSQN